MMHNASALKLIGILGLIWILLSAQVHAAPRTLIILTSFSEPVSQGFAEAFEAANPGIRVRFINKKTAATLTHLEKALSPRPDLVMASATDAFDLLTEKQLLVPYDSTGDNALPYTQFGYSGYGLMWNREYLQQLDLPAPRSWDSLLNPVYRNHIGMSSPTRSGTTHILVETVLQQRGWEAGWTYLNRLASNLATVTARSFGVRQGVIQQRFGIGLVIDFFAFTAQPDNPEIELTYPAATSFLPVSIGIVRGGAEPELAGRFIDFLLSEGGQKLLLQSNISRYPIRTSVLEQQPEHPLNRYRQQLTNTLNYDLQQSRRRYHLVNALFDQLITLRLPFIKQAWSELQAIEKDPALLGRPDLQQSLAAIRARLSEMPFPAQQLTDHNLLAQFSQPLPGASMSSAQRNQQLSWQRWSRTQQTEVISALGEVRASLIPVRDQ